MNTTIPKMLTQDQKRLLYLIWRYTGDSEDKHGRSTRWIKHSSLVGIVSRCIMQDWYQDYDLSMDIIDIENRRIFIRISQEMLLDISKLYRGTLLEVLKISSSSYDIVTGYRVKNIKDICNIETKIQEKFNNILICSKCSNLLLLEYYVFDNQVKAEFKCKQEHSPFEFFELFELLSPSYSSEPYNGVEHGI
jgi:hypothetical protein